MPLNPSLKQEGCYSSEASIAQDHTANTILNLKTGLNLLSKKKMNYLLHWGVESCTMWWLWCTVARSCTPLFNPMDCSSPGSSAHGIVQARVLEWVAIFSTRESSQPRDWTHVSCTAGRFFTAKPSGKSLLCDSFQIKQNLRTAPETPNTRRPRITAHPHQLAHLIRTEGQELNYRI